MSTATYTPMGASVMTQTKQLRPELLDLANDLLALKEMAKSGILTHHSQRELVKRLSARDMADVARYVLEVERRQRPIFNRNK
jgi:hypothetical protein